MDKWISVDDRNGRRHIGDAIYFSGDVCWAAVSIESRKLWNHSKEYYIDCGNDWDRWEGQGPCRFYQVTHWMELPGSPAHCQPNKGVA